MERNGIDGPAGKGIDRVPHLGAAIVAGQGGPARGGVQSLVDLELGFPGALLLMTVGRLARPLLAPLLVRTTPLPRRTRVVILATLGCGGLALLVARRRTGRAH